MTINLINTDHSVHHSQVEWDVITRIIAQFAYFERNKEELVGKIYLGKLDLLSTELIRTQSYLKEVKDEYRQVLGQVFSKLPADKSLERFRAHISKKGVLSFSELNKLTILIECGLFIKKDFPLFKLAEFQNLAEVDFLPVQRKFLKEFRHLVDDTGEVHFERHPELADLNRRLRELEEKIRKSVQEWITDPNNQKILQYSSYDVHHDRYVVPVRSDSYRSEIGMIVSRSESGQTLFVEPTQVRELCNRRMETIAKIDEIINHLAMKFSHALYDFSELLDTIYHLFLKMDFYLAKSSFANQYALECPSIRSTPGFKFTHLFHPLLKNAVKNNADCSSKEHGIVISGPNTGGKTVFLKSLTLSYLLFYHGFFVPAAEAEMYPYEGIFYFGNDLQNLQTGLSSFSGEVKNYIELMENILPSNLILIDEIFNSTSSDEASALSLSYFDELHKRAICHIVVSTHHQMFKTLIHQDRNYISCHVGFDTKAMRPTYKIQWGTPGASMAIDIFRILARNNPDVIDIPDKALTHLSAKNVSYETLLQRVSQKQIELDHLLSSNHQLETEMKNQKGAMEGVLNLKLNDELSKAKKEVEKILQEARDLVEDARRQEITKVKRIDEKSHQLNVKLRALKQETEEPEPITLYGDLSIHELNIGDTVYSITFKKEFTVLNLDPRKNEALIGKGPIKINVPITSLANSKRASHQPKVSVSFSKNTDAKFEYDVRGMRLSECQNLIENALGDLLTDDIPFMNVIHGHGDGILKNWLRDYIKKSKEFQQDLAENGNDGETRIILK
jgi:DNA mismatch repair protein MutS2